MFQTVLIRQVEDLIPKKRLIEARLLTWIVGDERAPDPLSWRRQEIRWVATAGREYSEYSSIRVGKDRLPASLRKALGIEQNLGSVCQGGLLRSIHVADENECQPRRLPVFVVR